MNITKTLSIVAFSALLFTGCKDTSKDGNLESPDNEMVTDTTQIKETAANLETTSFKIDGMTCPMGCAATIERKLAGLNGVEQAKVDFDSKTATISFDAEKQTPEQLVQTVEGIANGAYKVSDVTSSGDKAYFDIAKDKKKKKKKAKKTTETTDAKDCKEGKKAGCCTGSAGKSCHEVQTM